MVNSATQESDKTLLHYSAQAGNLAIVNHLLEKGSDLDKQDKANISVLHYAVASGHTDLVQFVIEQKKKACTDSSEDLHIFMTHQDRFGYNILHVAVLHKDLGMVQFLCKKLSQIDQPALEDMLRQQSQFHDTTPEKMVDFVIPSLSSQDLFKHTFTTYQPIDQKQSETDQLV